MRLSVIIPVYYNEPNLRPLYNDIREKILSRSDIETEIVMVNDGSRDRSYQIMQEIAKEDSRVRIFSLSRNFGSHAAILCGLDHCTGDCAVIKAADLQEPTELIIEMLDSWRNGFNVVLAARKSRPESTISNFFSNAYYWLVRNTSFPNMPKSGFDIYLIDRKVIEVIKKLDEKNSALTGQILWSGFRTSVVYYDRLERTAGKSRWTLSKKLRLVSDTLYSFSTVPITFISAVGALSFFVALVWGIVVFVSKLCGQIETAGWTSLFIFSLAAFGIIMLTLGIIGNYLWRAFDACRARPPYIIEDEGCGAPEDSSDRGRR